MAPSGEKVRNSFLGKEFGFKSQLFEVQEGKALDLEKGGDKTLLG